MACVKNDDDDDKGGKRQSWAKAVGGAEGRGLRKSTTDIARKPRRAAAHVETKPSHHTLHILTATNMSLLPRTLSHLPNHTPPPLDPPPQLRKVKTYTARTQQLQTTPPHNTRAIPGPQRGVGRCGYAATRLLMLKLVKGGKASV